MMAELKMGDAVDVLAQPAMHADNQTPCWYRGEVISQDTATGDLRVALECSGAIITLPPMMSMFAPYGSKADR